MFDRNVEKAKNVYLELIYRRTVLVESTLVNSVKKLFIFA